MVQGLAGDYWDLVPTQATHHRITEQVVQGAEASGTRSKIIS